MCHPVRSELRECHIDKLVGQGENWRFISHAHEAKTNDLRLKLCRYREYASIRHHWTMTVDSMKLRRANVSWTHGVKITHSNCISQVIIRSYDNHCIPSLVEVRLLLLQVADLKERDRGRWMGALSTIVIV